MSSKRIGARFHYDNVYGGNRLELKSLKLIQIGELCLEAGFEYEPHQQHCNEISYIVSGKGEFVHNGVGVNVATGDIIITPKRGVHAIRASESDALDYCYLGFEFAEDDSEIADRYFKTVSDIQVIKPVRHDIYERFRNVMFEIYRRKELDKMMVESYLVQIIVLACRKSQKYDEIYEEGQKSDIGRTAYLIMEYIDQNIEKKLTVASVAENLGYSTFYASHLFKAKMHRTLQEYITTQKIEKAKKLLSLDRYSVTAVSEKLSFLNLQTFSRSFKRETGMSPTQYIEKIKKTE